MGLFIKKHSSVDVPFTLDLYELLLLLRALFINYNLSPQLKVFFIKAIITQLRFICREDLMFTILVYFVTYTY